MRFRIFRSVQSNMCGPGAATDGPMIELRHVTKIYSGSTIPALQSLDLRISRGEAVAVLGKSGAGKTTLINMISALDRPTSGEVLVAGTAVHMLGDDAAAAWRGRTVGIVYQSFQLMPTLTVVENVMLPMDVANRWSPGRCMAQALRLLADVDIAEHARKLPSAVSGGQQQRIAVARALANDPPIILADEPTGSLDTLTARTIVQLFDRLVAQGRTLVVVTHDHDLAGHFERVIELADGVIVDDVRRIGSDVAYLSRMPIATGER